MSESTKELSSVNVGARGMTVRTMEDLTLFAQMVGKSGLAPRGLQTVPQICLAVQAGLEIGFTPFQALQSFCVINGKAALYGDGATALVNGSGEVESWSEWYEVDGKRLDRPPTSADLADGLTAVCAIKRRNRVGAAMGSFSIADARRAKLFGKSGPWQDYPLRMLMWRARSWAMRDGFSDVMRGVGIVEEVRDANPEPREAEYATLSTLGPKVEAVDERAPESVEPEPPRRAAQPAPVTDFIPCEACGGRGHTDPDDVESGCATCGGSGEVPSPVPEAGLYGGEGEA